MIFKVILIHQLKYIKVVIFSKMLFNLIKDPYTLNIFDETQTPKERRHYRTMRYY